MIKNTLKDLRKQRHLTQEQLAERLNVSQSTVASWENGKRRPDLSLLPEIAEFFGVSVDDLLGRESNQSAVNTDPWNTDDLTWAEKADETTRLMARGMSKLSPDNRQRLLDVARAMFKEDFDEEGNKR